MEAYLQYRRIGKQIQKQLEADPENARDLPCLSQQHTRVVHGRSVLVVEWDGPDDPQNPRNWSFSKRTGATLIISSMGFLVGAAAPIDSAVLPQAAQDLGVSEITETLATAVFLIGFGVGALLCGPFSEVLGRSLTYISTLAILCIFLMASALAPDIGAQVVFRFCAGFSGATPLVCAGGSISDMWAPLQKTYMFPVFAIGGFGGPALGPVMAGWIADSPILHTWRWAEWVALSTAAVVFLLTFFFIPESYPPLLLSWKARHLRRLTGDNRYYAEHEIIRIPLSMRLRTALPRPFIMAFYEPVIVLITLYMSVLYIVLFTFFDGYTFIFQKTYGISQGLTNTIFVGIFVGVLGGALTVPYVYRLTVRAQREAEGRGQKQFDPELRLWFAMLGGAFAIPISLIWMAWTAYPHISIWSPILASVLFGYGTITIFFSCYMYLIDSYEMFAASGLTFVTLVRYVIAGAMTIVGIPFYQNVGVHWTLTIMACISALMAPIPYVFYVYGHVIRKRSRFAVNRPNGGDEGPTIPVVDATKEEDTNCPVLEMSPSSLGPPAASCNPSSMTLSADENAGDEEEMEAMEKRMRESEMPKGSEKESERGTFP